MCPAYLYLMCGSLHVGNVLDSMLNNEWDRDLSWNVSSPENGVSVLETRSFYEIRHCEAGIDAVRSKNHEGL